MDEIKKILVCSALDELFHCYRDHLQRKTQSAAFLKQEITQSQRLHHVDWMLQEYEIR